MAIASIMPRNRRLAISHQCVHSSVRSSLPLLLWFTGSRPRMLPPDGSGDRRHSDAEADRQTSTGSFPDGRCAASPGSSGARTVTETVWKGGGTSNARNDDR